MSWGTGCIFIQRTSFKNSVSSFPSEKQRATYWTLGQGFSFCIVFCHRSLKNSFYQTIFKITTYSYASQHIPTLSSPLWQVFNWAKTLFLLRCKFGKTRSLLPQAGLAEDKKATPVLGMAMLKCRYSSGNIPMVTNYKTCPSCLLPGDYNTDMDWEVCA